MADIRTLRWSSRIGGSQGTAVRNGLDLHQGRGQHNLYPERTPSALEIRSMSFAIRFDLQVAHRGAWSPSYWTAMAVFVVRHFCQNHEAPIRILATSMNRIRSETRHPAPDTRHLTLDKESQSQSFIVSARQDGCRYNTIDIVCNQNGVCPWSAWSAILVSRHRSRFDVMMALSLVDYDQV